MSSLEQVSSAFETLRRVHAEDRLAHAYLVIGPPAGAAGVLVQSILKLLFCTAARPPCGDCVGCRQAEAWRHPDVHVIEPARKSRILDIEQVRELNEVLGQTAYAGGWKVGVLMYADRMKEQAANAFLKTLEEPPGRTLLLLVTDQPQALLPTIVSRCQRVVAGDEHRVPAWHEEVLSILATPSDTRLARLMQAGRLRALLDGMRASWSAEEKEAAADEEKDVMDARVQARVVAERAAMLRMLSDWRRDVLAVAQGGAADDLHFPGSEAALRRAAASLTIARALAAVEAVETLARRLELNVPEAAAFEEAFLA